MAATKLQKDYSFVSPQCVTELLNDYPSATTKYVKKLLEDYPIATLGHVNKLLKACPYASLQDVVNRILSVGPYTVRLLRHYGPDAMKSIIPDYINSMFDSCIHHINAIRENEALNGREHVRAGPLLHVHSMHVQPKKALRKRQLAVYGTIRVCFQNISSGEQMQLDVYNRSAKDAERINSSGGYLTLGWPHDDMWTQLQGTTIVVDLYLKIGNKGVPFSKEDIFVGDTAGDNFEKLMSKEFHCKEVCSATLTYIAMPFASLCLVNVILCGKDEGRVVNVAGTIVARYKSTYGNYNKEPCVLFEKKNGFEPVVMNNELILSRAWLGLPAYSSLELDLDLMDYDTNRKIRRRVELLKGNGVYAGDYAEAADDFAIVLDAGLVSYPSNGNTGWSDFDKSLAMCHLKDGFESLSSNSGNLRCGDQGQTSIPIPSQLVEFYSLFIYCKTKPTLKIVGSVEFTSDFSTQYLFKSNGNDGVEVEDPQKVLPLKDACMSFDEYGTLELKVNLQDIGGKFANRGFTTYKLGAGFPTSCFNTQICSVFPGKDGFSALHYSLFPSACQANIEIIFKIKSFHSGVKRIYGNAIAYNSNFDYSTKFKRDYFRSVLFRRTEKDPVQLKNDGEVPLSRNVVAVPMDSSLVIEVDFCGVSLKDHLICNRTFMIGHCYFKEETNDYDLEIKLTWGDELHQRWSEPD